MNPDNVAAFLEAIERLSRLYGLSLAHEDVHGAFIVEPFSEENILWLKSAHLHLSEDEDE